MTGLRHTASHGSAHGGRPGQAYIRFKRGDTAKASGYKWIYENQDGRERERDDGAILSFVSFRLVKSDVSRELGLSLKLGFNKLLAHEQFCIKVTFNLHRAAGHFVELRCRKKHAQTNLKSI